MTGLLPERYPFYVGWKIDVEVHEIKLVIRNIIFDMVGVVIRFDTEKYYNEHIINNQDRELLKREVFGSVEWARQDRGTICDGMLLKTIKIALWVLFTNSYAEEGELNVIVKDGIDLTKL